MLGLATRAYMPWAGEHVMLPQNNCSMAERQELFDIHWGLPAVKQARARGVGHVERAYGNSKIVTC